MATGSGTLRFTLARTVNLVAVSSGPRPTGPDALPAHVRLVDLATAGELAEIAASLEAVPAAEVDAGTEVGVEAGSPSPDPGALDGLIARAEARLVAIRAGSRHTGPREARDA